MNKCRNYLFRGLIFLFLNILIFSLPINTPIHAQDSDEIQILEEKITELEKRIIELESLLYRYDIQNKLQKNGEFGWENKKNWRMLEPGMTLDQVKALLGEPVKTIKGVKTFWYYPNIYCGYVSFDEKGLVSGWNEP